jgi:hypothetical protein
MPENHLAVKMKFIGLLTHEQKQAGYFVSQDEDFIWLWHTNNGHPDIVAIFLYDDARVKQIREAADKHRQELPARKPES